MASTQSSANKAHYEAAYRWLFAEWVRPKLGLAGQSCQAVRR